MEPEPIEEKPLNLVEEARLVRDDIVKQREELKAEREALEKVKSDKILSGDTGSNIEPVAVSPEQQKINNASEFFKGTGLGDAITKANE